MFSFKAFKNLFDCFRQVFAVEIERLLLSQLAKSPEMRAETNSWAMPNARRLPGSKPAQKSSQNPLKKILNSRF